MTEMSEKRKKKTSERVATRRSSCQIMKTSHKISRKKSEKFGNQDTKDCETNQKDSAQRR